MNRQAANDLIDAIAAVSDAPYFDAECPPSLETLGRMYEEVRQAGITLANAMPNQKIAQANRLLQK